MLPLIVIFFLLLCINPKWLFIIASLRHLVLARSIGVHLPNLRLPAAF
jgi:hypothetical protein